MTLLRNGVVESDRFTDVRSQETLPVDGDVIVGLDQWQARRSELLARPGALGIVLRSDQRPEQIADDLAHFEVVALEFPRFQDGRAYSCARLLRERYGYAGELRAVGNVLLEQLHFMHRVGFNAFALESGDPVRDWEVAASEISVWYQPAGDGRPSVIELRHRERPTARAASGGR